MLDIFEIAKKSENKKNKLKQNRSYLWGDIAAIYDVFAYHVSINKIEKKKFEKKPMTTFVKYYFTVLNLYIFQNQNLHEFIVTNLSESINLLIDLDFFTDDKLDTQWVIGYNNNKFFQETKKLTKNLDMEIYGIK
jgi:hypothetical protein